MPRIQIERVQNLAPAAFPDQAGVSLSGAVETTGVICSVDAPLLLWVHALQPGAQITFDASPVGHVLYVLDGEVEQGGAAIPGGDALIVEHRARATVTAGGAGARLAHFHERFNPARPPVKAGGHVHGRQHPGAYDNTDSKGKLRTSFADSACPTCELWLHRSILPGNIVYPYSHYHTEPEIILVLDGELVLGRDTLGPLTAIAVDANTHYKIDSGQAELCFVNFRSSEPYLVRKQADGSHLSYNEREYGQANGQLPGIRMPARTAAP